MYPEEIRRFLEERNYLIGGDDLINIINIENSPQINSIKYNTFDNSYEIWDCYGNYYKFLVIPYEDSKYKKLIKGRKKT